MRINGEWVKVPVEMSHHYNDDRHHQCQGLYDSHYISKVIIPGTEIPQWWLEWGTGHDAVSQCPSCNKELK